MSDINLLPTDLRGKEEEERKVPPPATPRLGFTAANNTVPLPTSKIETPVAKTFSSLSQAKPQPNKAPTKLPEDKKTSRPSWWSTFKLWLSTPPGTKVSEAVNHNNISGNKQVSRFPAKAVSVPLGVLLDVNLLPVDVKSRQGAKRYGLRLVGIAVLAILVVGALYAGLTNLAAEKEQELAKVRAEAIDLNSAIKEFDPTVKKLQEVGRRIKIAETIFGQRNDWLKFFNSFESLGVQGVSFITMSSSSDGKVNVSAEGVSVAALARQLLAFQNATDVISNVQMSGVSGGEPTEKDQPVLYAASFSLELKNNFLAKTPSEKASDKSKSVNK